MKQSLTNTVKSLPLFAAEALVLSTIFKSNWKTAAKDYIDEVKASFDFKKRKADSGISKYDLTKIKSIMYFDSLKDVEDLIKTEADYARQYHGGMSFSKADGYIEDRIAKHTALFASAYPGRFIIPGIKQIINTIKDDDPAKLQAKINNLLSGDDYWDQLGRVQTSRVWSAQFYNLSKMQSLS